MKFPYVLSFLLCSLCSVSGAGQRMLDRESFYLELRNELEKSLKRVEYSRVEKTVRIENELARSQDPWSISNYAKEHANSSSPKYRDFTDTLTLQYQNQNGFNFQASVDYYNSNEFGTYGASNRYSRSNYSLSLSQDLMALFKKSSFELNQEVVSLQGKAKLVANESNYLSEVLKVADLSYKLFSAICKKKDLEKIISLAKTTLKTSEVQQAARTISMRDFLRIKATYLSVERQLQSAIYEIQSAQHDFSAFSEGSYRKAQSLSLENLVCEGDFNRLKSTHFPEREELKAIYAKHPSILAIELSKETLKKKFENYRLGRNLKVELSGGYDKINNVPGVSNVTVTDPYDQAFVGLKITYQFQGGYYDSYRQSIAEQYQDLSISQKQTYLEIEEYLDGLYDEIVFYKSQVQLVAESIQNASRVLKIIETQQSIGQVDATAIESAYQSEIQAQSEKRIIWSQISSTALKLQEIKKAAEQAAALR